MASRQNASSSSGGMSRGSATTVVMPRTAGAVGEGGSGASVGGTGYDLSETIQSTAGHILSLANRVLETTESGARDSLPHMDLDDLIVLPSEDPDEFNLVTIQVDGMQLTSSNIAYDALRQHFQETDRDAKWLDRTNTLLQCAAIACVFDAVGTHGLSEYKVTPKVALEYIKMLLADAACNVSDDAIRKKIRDTFSATSINELRVMYEGLPLNAEVHKIFLISEATLQLLTAVMGYVLSSNGQFSSRPYFRAEVGSDAFMRRLLDDIKKAIPLISTILQNTEHTQPARLVVWSVLSMMGFKVDSSKHPIDNPPVSSEQIQSLVITFLASAVLMQGGMKISKMTPKLFELVVLRVVHALTTKGATQSARSDARKAVSGAANLMLASSTNDLALTTALAASQLIHTGMTIPGAAHISIPRGMDQTLALIIHDLIQALAPIKVSIAGGVKDIVNEVFAWFVSNGFTNFDSDESVMQGELARLRAQVIPPSVMIPTEDDWVVKLVERFSQYWAKASDERTTLMKNALARFLARPLSSADEVASVHIQREELRKEKKAATAEKKRQRTEEDLRKSQAANDGLVLTAGILKKLKVVNGDGK